MALEAKTLKISEPSVSMIRFVAPFTDGARKGDAQTTYKSDPWNNFSPSSSCISSIMVEPAYKRIDVARRTNRSYPRGSALLFDSISVNLHYVMPYLYPTVHR